jgi:hypothetical protein
LVLELLRRRAGAGQGLVNGRKLSSIFGLLRNSTIFRCAKNSDSNSARRKPPKMLESLSRGLIVHQSLASTSPYIECGSRLLVSGFRSWPLPKSA